MAKERYIRFDVVRATCKQRIELVDPELTQAELESGLQSGKYVTTVQEGGDVIEVGAEGEGDQPFKIVAKVVDSDVDGEYDDFQVDET
jgi:hypothetical protein